MNSFAKSLDDPKYWRGITDQVMGGRSDLVINHRDGVFTMSGIVTTENNGGFVRLSNRVDIKSNDFKGIKFKAKGNKRLMKCIYSQGHQDASLVLSKHSV